AIATADQEKAAIAKGAAIATADPVKAARRRATTADHRPVTTAAPHAKAGAAAIATDAQVRLAAVRSTAADIVPKADGKKKPESDKEVPPIPLREAAVKLARLDRKDAFAPCPRFPVNSYRISLLQPVHL